jgi:hypothetical protein
MWMLNISQSYRPPRPVMGTALFFISRWCSYLTENTCGPPRPVTGIDLFANIPSASSILLRPSINIFPRFFPRYSRYLPPSPFYQSHIHFEVMAELYSIPKTPPKMRITITPFTCRSASPFPTQGTVPEYNRPIPPLPNTSLFHLLQGNRVGSPSVKYLKLPII